MILRAVVGRNLSGSRLDNAAAALFPQLSRGRIRRIVDWGGVRIGRSVVRVASRRVEEGDRITLAVTEPDPDVGPACAEADLLYEDGEYLAVNKASGTYCQRTPYQLKGTVEHSVGLMLRSRGIAGPARVIHRLDRETSGVMVFPKTRASAAYISRRLMAGEVEKVYWAVVDGGPGNRRWTVNAPIAAVGKSRYGVSPCGREAATAFRVLAQGAGGTLLEARPRTGRTHQIRVHLAHCGLPVAGDERYGGTPGPRMLLHCRLMAFRGEDGRKVAVTAPVDRTFLDLLAARGIPREPPE